jgi:hypothetical protein
MNPESALTASIVKAIRRRWPDSWTLKVHGHPGQTVGVPDLLVCVYGLLIALEVKCPRMRESVAHARARVTLPQRAQLDAIRRAGGGGAVVLSVEEALAAIRAVTGERETRDG